jgi:predicted N-acyltransferase
MTAPIRHRDARILADEAATASPFRATPEALISALSPVSPAPDTFIAPTARDRTRKLEAGARDATSQAPCSGGLATGTDIMTLSAIRWSARWPRALAGDRKDHRYYEIVDQTIIQGFDYRYVAIRNRNGAVGAIVPFFVLDLDLLAGTRGLPQWIARNVRRLWPSFMHSRAVMVGCAAGEGHLDDPDEISHEAQAHHLALALQTYARQCDIGMIVFKEFSARYRPALHLLKGHGFTTIPSFPAVRLNIAYASFDDYMRRALSRKTRKDLNAKFRKMETSAPIKLTVMRDITPIIDEIYPLYLQVYDRAQFRLEKLTKAYLCGLGQTMRDRVRFFVWRQRGRIIAFSLCMVHGEELHGEYLGFDERLAHDLHLYHYVFRDVVRWGMAHNFKTLRTNGTNYDPKLHLRFRLDPVDLYVRHTSPAINRALAWLLPFIEPTRYDPLLRRFPNYDELWDFPKP